MYTAEKGLLNTQELFYNILFKHAVAPVYQIFHATCISVTNTIKGYSQFYFLFTSCLSHIWAQSGVCRYAKLLHCIACHNCMWLVIGTT
jgi:hypothetical protein